MFFIYHFKGTSILKNNYENENRMVELFLFEDLLLNCDRYNRNIEKCFPITSITKKNTNAGV